MLTATATVDQVPELESVAWTRAEIHLIHLNRILLQFPFPLRFVHFVHFLLRERAA